MADIDKLFELIDGVVGPPVKVSSETNTSDHEILDKCALQRWNLAGKPIGQTILPSVLAETSATADRSYGLLDEIDDLLKAS
ncbi:hypothetical protein KDA00_04255 [Candidatus Saccharibacteria bacterium]|nr:hypothetical protein [Candidatus Saccharibacteria bacterium]